MLKFLTTRTFSTLVLLARVLLAIQLCILPMTVTADPISKEAAQEWSDHVRRIMRVAPDFDLRAEAEARAKKAKAEIMVRPTAGALRDLADAYHSLGHYAEHDHDYIRALQFHNSALALYLEARMPTRESWDDGVEHALEHIFMDLYDYAILSEQKADNNLAEELFLEVWDHSQKVLKVAPDLLRGQRFAPRYSELIRRRKNNGQFITPKDLKILGYHCQFLLSGGVYSEL